MPAKSAAYSTILATLVALCACDELPKDPERTTELVRENREIRLGMIAGVPLDPAAARTLAEAARRLGARVTKTQGPGELLLARLERGQLDLVYGTFAANSPWKTNVHFGDPPGWRVPPPKDHEAPRFAFRLGENEWIMQMERIEP